MQKNLELAMEIYSQIVPAIVILGANLLSGPHGSSRYEHVTAVFGWACVCSFPLAFVASWTDQGGFVEFYLWQIFGFSMITSISRDYEKILRPLFPWNR